MSGNNERQTVEAENNAFSLAVLSVIGDRKDQQDSFGQSLRENSGLVVVCDGMGGFEEGKTASDLAVKIFLSQYQEEHFEEAPIDNMIAAAKKADAAISDIRSGSGKRLNSGSTLVSIFIDHKKLFWCSVGDSRGYLIRNGIIVQFTQDQNYNTVLLEEKNSGHLDDREFQKEKKMGEALISYLGIGGLELIDYSAKPFDLIEGDKIVIMSDGLYKLVSNHEIQRIIENFSNITEALNALDLKANRNSLTRRKERDNMTVAIVKIK